MTMTRGLIETGTAMGSGTAERARLVPPGLEPLPVREDGREVVKVLVIGSPRAVENTIRVLYLRGFAELYEWSPMQPTQNPGEVMSLLRRSVNFG